MRKLKTSDVFTAARLIKSLGLKDDAKELANKSTTGADLWDNGFEFVWAAFEKAADAKNEKAIYDFLSGPFEMDPKKVADLELDELIDLLKKLAEENDLARFFRSAGALMK